MANDRFDKFTERARRVLTYAQEEARSFNHNYIGTEHLLLGLIREGGGVAAKVLRSLGVELDKVRSQVEFIIGRGERMISGEIGLTPRAKKVIELAVDEARRLGHHYIGTEHLLLGLVREGEGVAAGVLERLGVNLERVRTQTIQVLTQSNRPDQGAAREGRGPSDSGALPETQRGLESVRGAAGWSPARWDYLVAQVEYPQWDDLAAHTEHPRPEAGGVIKRFLGPDDAHVDLHGKPVHEALTVLGAEGWELVAIDHPAPAGGPGGHYYVFKRTAFEEGSSR
jgi:Clp amino terminal domain, pathogenicity island component